MVEHIFLPVPTPQTKGVLVIPTIFGNLLAGPTAEDLPLGADDATDTTPEGLQVVLSGASRLLPAIVDQPDPEGINLVKRDPVKHSRQKFILGDEWILGQIDRPRSFGGLTRQSRAMPL